MKTIDYTEILEMSTAERQRYMNESPTILPTMLANIGNEHAQIRDQHNYRLFILALSENAWSENSIHQFVEQLASNEGLTFQLGEKQAISVYQRSYSALFLAAIVNADRQLAYLTEHEIAHIAQQAIELLDKEQDLRSFVNEQQGWAHSIANVSELLCAIIQHPKYPIRYTAQILQAIRAAIWKGYVFQDDEEERFCNIIEALLAKGIDEQLFIEWVEQLFDRLERIAYEQGYSAVWFKARTNQLNLVKTLYFYLKFTNGHEQLRGVVSIFIQRWIKLT